MVYNDLNKHRCNIFLHFKVTMAKKTVIGYSTTLRIYLLVSTVRIKSLVMISKTEVENVHTLHRNKFLLRKYKNWSFYANVLFFKTFSARSSSCHDTRHDCSRYEWACHVSRYSSWVEKWCKKTCGKCVTVHHGHSNHGNHHQGHNTHGAHNTHGNHNSHGNHGK